MTREEMARVRLYTVYAVRGPCGYYIGCTAQALQTRLEQHFSVTRLRKSRAPLHEAIRVHGEAAFTIEALAQVRGSFDSGAWLEAAIVHAAFDAGDVVFNVDYLPRTTSPGYVPVDECPHRQEEHARVGAVRFQEQSA